MTYREKVEKRINSLSDFKNLLNLSQKLNIKSFKLALEQIFTPYQIQIIIKKINNIKLSKTDSEVFSRIIKKKLIAIANEQLYNLCQKIIYE
jgi:hypothetical protein